jgi:hypothetical protein
MKSKVYFYRIDKGGPEEIGEGIKALWDKLNFKVKQGDIVGIKLHMGEKGNETYLKPFMISPLVKEIRAFKGKLLLFDTTTLYRFQRQNAIDYLQLACEHGYSIEKVGAPILIADGIKGLNGKEVSIRGNRLAKAEIASLLFELDSMVVASHFKGHLTTGFGGAIKNIGMGCTTKRGKSSQHRATTPFINRDKCEGYGGCIKACKGNAISLINGKAYLDVNKCTSCLKCVDACPNQAVGFNPNVEEELQIRLADATSAVYSLFKDKSVCCFNYLLDITKYCDCNGEPMSPLLPDIGILASYDPVAIDQASLDLLNKAYGANLFKSLHGTDGSKQLEAGEKIGLGKRSYEIIEI